MICKENFMSSIEISKLEWGNRPILCLRNMYRIIVLQ